MLCDFGWVGARPHQFELPTAKPFSETRLQAHRDWTRLRAKDVCQLADLRAVASQDNQWRLRVELKRKASGNDLAVSMQQIVRRRAVGSSIIHDLAPGITMVFSQ
jgi:hypothetical protein